MGRDEVAGCTVQREGPFSEWIRRLVWNDAVMQSTDVPRCAGKWRKVCLHGELETSW